MRNKYRTRERLTIKIVKMNINTHIVVLIHEHHNITNGTYHKRAQWACLTYHAACKVEFQPPIGGTHSWRFSIFNKIDKPLESAPRGSTSDPKFRWCNNGEMLVCHTRRVSSSLWRRNEPLGYYFTILDRMFGLIGGYYRGVADSSFCC